MTDNQTACRGALRRNPSIWELMEVQEKREVYLSQVTPTQMGTQGEEIWGDDELTAAHVGFGASEGHPRGLEQQLRPQMGCSEVSAGVSRHLAVMLCRAWPPL